MTAQFVMPVQAQFDFETEIIVDNFAGGGGATAGMERALGRTVTVAINHDPDAIRMHETNHPYTQHYCESVWDVDPVEVAAGRRVGHAWFSPDCKHFSKAKGGTPVNKEIRGLAWVAVRWALLVEPRVMYLENVEEFRTWGPLIRNAKNKWYPDPGRAGETFEGFRLALTTGLSPRHPAWREAVQALGIEWDLKAKLKLKRGAGYQVEFKELRASHHGVPTIRRRLFMVARRDGQPIVWPEQSHFERDSEAVRESEAVSCRPAHEVIDFSLPVKSIFERSRPLADNTLRRIAKGIRKFVFENPEPFIVRLGQTGFGGDGLQYSIRDPLTTVTSKAEHCLVVPHLQRQFGSSTGSDMRDPMGTVMPGGQGKTALCAALLEKYSPGAVADLSVPAPDSPVGEVCTSHLLKFRGTCQDGQSVRDPLPTITAGGKHIAEVRCFLLKYYGTNIGQDLKTPLHTVPTRDRFGLVMIHGNPWQIVDIGFRMLQPRELFLAQGFEPDYIIDRDWRGKPFTKEQQVARCGNAVCPPLAEALVRANLTPFELRMAA